MAHPIPDRIPKLQFLHHSWIIPPVTYIVQRHNCTHVGEVPLAILEGRVGLNFIEILTQAMVPLSRLWVTIVDVDSTSSQSQAFTFFSFHKMHPRKRKFISYAALSVSLVVDTCLRVSPWLKFFAAPIWSFYCKSFACGWWLHSFLLNSNESASSIRVSIYIYMRTKAETTKITYFTTSGAQRRARPRGRWRCEEKEQQKSELF